MKFLLDTNIAIYAIKQRNPSVTAHFEENAERMCLSSISVAELLFGAEKSHNMAKARAVVENFCSRVTVLDYDRNAAAHYASIRAHLESLGTPIGVNDLHIAAHARSRGMTLVSNNLREFVRVPGLLTENWVKNWVADGP